MLKTIDLSVKKSRDKWSATLADFSEWSITWLENKAGQKWNIHPRQDYQRQVIEGLQWRRTQSNKTKNLKRWPTLVIYYFENSFMFDKGSELRFFIQVRHRVFSTCPQVQVQLFDVGCLCVPGVRVWEGRACVSVCVHTKERRNVCVCVCSSVVVSDVCTLAV